MRRSLLLALAITAYCALRADAQEVGYPPAGSPFRDLEYRHELTLFGGWYSARKDPAGVAPQDAPTLGLRYELGIGGPAALMTRFSYVASERRALKPDAPAATRDLGKHPAPLSLFDVGVSLNLTGQKSWRRLVPTVNGGLGMVRGGGSKVEGDPFDFGSHFALTYGVGLRYVPGGRFQLRGGLDGYLYRISYPSEYYVAASDGTQVVPASQVRSFWKNNAALTIGASYLFFR